MFYYIQRADRIDGPYSTDEIKQALAERRIAPSDPAATSSLGPWRPLHEVLADNDVDVPLAAAPVAVEPPSPAGAQPTEAAYSETNPYRITGVHHPQTRSRDVQPLAMISFVSGLLSFFGVCCICLMPASFAAIVTGVLALTQSSTTSGTRTLAIIGIVTAVLSLLFSVAVFIAQLAANVQ